MCGVAGYFNLDGHPADDTAIAGMVKAINHRGPDSQGQCVEGALALGHTRLSIIDLTDQARQPMESQDGRYVVSYNGEIYNFRELRSELEAAGEKFRSHSDTEVLLVSIKVWGVRALNRFNGMFAFALWDRWEKKLTLARDRYGIKPLYYTFVGKTLIFGSEIKALLAHPQVGTSLNPHGLAEYLSFQNFFSKNTLFKNIHLFPRASYAEFRIGNDPVIRKQQYWDYQFEEPGHIHSDSQYEEEGRHLLEQAVKRQLVSDVSIGSYLSGGMDSGAITSIAARSLPHMHTFTCGFDLSSASGMELYFDERDAAERMSYLCKTEHYEVVLKAGDMERALPRLAYHLEEPRVGQSYPNYYAARLASKFGKVVLSGAGGDEIFGGYPWRYHRALTTPTTSFTDDYYSFWQRLVPTEQFDSLLSPIKSDIRDYSARETFSSVFPSQVASSHSTTDAINACLYFEASTFLQGLLIVEDKISMSHGLETRVPFLDNDLVDFAMKIPIHMKIRHLKDTTRLDENEIAKGSKHFQRTKDGKVLLRNVASSFLPKEFAKREKQGFSAPDASWFKGESIDFVRNTILDQDAKIFEFLDYKTTSTLVESHLSGQQNRRLLIWSLLNLEAWCEQFL